ncbi:MAG: hypothetical protein R6U27_05565, partial [Desulfobacterales bacterium]
MAPENPRVSELRKLTEQAENKGLFVDKRKIGFKKHWEKILNEKGLVVEGHSIVRSIKTWNGIERHKTAIDRYRLS